VLELGAPGLAVLPTAVCFPLRREAATRTRLRQRATSCVIPVGVPTTLECSRIPQINRGTKMRRAWPRRRARTLRHIGKLDSR
jgi:hypothetical protein